MFLQEVSIRLSYVEKIGCTGRTDGRSDGRVEHLMRPPSKGHITKQDALQCCQHVNV